MAIKSWLDSSFETSQPDLSKFLKYGPIYTLNGNQCFLTSSHKQFAIYLVTPFAIGNTSNNHVSNFKLPWNSNDNMSKCPSTTSRSHRIDDTSIFTWLSDHIKWKFMHNEYIHFSTSWDLLIINSARIYSAQLPPAPQVNYLNWKGDRDHGKLTFTRDVA